MARLKIDNLHKAYGPVEVLKGIDLEIEDGGFLVLVGPSGCGKSTLLNCIAGLEELSAGDIRIGDRSVADANVFLADEVEIVQSRPFHHHPADFHRL